jgi:hypothetical protein
MNIKYLIEQVKYNCNLSDAKFWGYFSICGLLLRLRELYRHEKGLMPWEKIPSENIARWLDRREKLWKELENENFKPIEINGNSFGVYDVEGINRILNKKGLIYGGGLGIYGKPTFFLAKLEEKKELYDYSIYYIEKELCRDLFTSTAMLQGTCIFIRKEQLILLLWEKIQEIRQKTEGIFNSMLLSHFTETELNNPANLFEKLKLISSNISDIFVYHEIGEAIEDKYSHYWQPIVGKDRWLEMHLRGLKDIIADTSEYGPLKLITKSRDKKLFLFYLLFLDAIRKSFLPNIWNLFSQTVDWKKLEEMRILSYKKTESILEKISEQIERDGPSSVKIMIEDYIKSMKINSFSNP